MHHFGFDREDLVQRFVTAGFEDVRHITAAEVTKENPGERYGFFDNRKETGLTSGY